MKRKDIEKLLHEGFIGEDQAAAIVRHYRLDDDSLSRKLRVALSLLAGVLILLGIILEVSANWYLIPPGVKMVGGILLLLAFWVAYRRVEVKKPLSAEVLAFLGAGMWLANIALYGQIFQLQNPFVEGCFLFFIGVAAIPFLTRQRLLIGAVAWTSAVLLGAMCDDHETSWLTLPSGARPELLLIPLFTLWWMLGERWRNVRGSFLSSYGWIAAPAAIAMLFTLQLIALHKKVVPVGDTHLFLQALAPTLMILLFLKPRVAPWRPWLAITGATGLVFLCPFMAGENEMAFTLLRVAVYFGYGLVWMYGGLRSNQPMWINLGSLCVIFSAAALTFDICKSLSASGAALILMGIALLAAGWLLHRLRNKLLSKVSTSNNSPLSRS